MCMLLNRSLVGDLTREETRQLYIHLAKCRPCHKEMEELVDLEANLDDLNRVYETFSLEDTFNERVKATLASVENEMAPSDIERREECERIIQKHVLLTMGVCAIPIPIVDFLGTAGVQLKMLRKMSRLYSVNSGQRVKSILASLAGGIAPIELTKGIFGSIFKPLPGIGHLLSAVTLSLSAGAMTYAVGKVFIQHFESGGTFLDFDPAKVKEYFFEQFKEGQLKFSSTS